MSNCSEVRRVIGETNIHLDFHTPQFQREVGRDFDADRFADRLVAANVDSVTFFAKGCHGSAYYDSSVGPRHPHMAEDLLAATVAACRERDIGILAYYTLAWDNLPGKENPDWYQRDGDGNALAAETVDDRWEWLCLNSPYTEELVYPQVRELLEYEIDGIWFDILVYHEDACTCRYCVRSMREQGLDPDDPADRLVHRTQVCETFVDRTTELIKDRDEDMVVTYNHRLNLGLTTTLQGGMDYIVIESLPSGWGYMHTPTFARYARNLDRPVQGMTGIFHKVWGDFGTVKSSAQLRYELSNSVMHHLSVSVGDQLLPRGELEPAKYDVIGEAFAFVKDRTLPPAEPVRDIAVLLPGNDDPAGPESGMNPDDPEMRTNGAVAATKFLCETHQQFDILDDGLVDELNVFNVVVLPNTGALHSKTVEAIRSFVGDGGKLLATGTSSLREDEFALADVLGVTHRGRLPYTTAYFGLEDFAAGLPDIDCVSYGGFQSIGLDGARSAAQVVAPTTERSETRRFSHFQAPPERTLDVPSITHHEYGEGEAVYVGTDLVRQYYAEDYHGHRQLLDNIVTSLQDVRVIESDAPTHIELNAMTTDEATYLHVSNYHTSRAGASLGRINEDPCTRDVGVRILAPTATTVEPVTDVEIRTDRSGEFLHVTFDEVGVHEVVRIE